jgi:hypothetical protein
MRSRAEGYVARVLRLVAGANLLLARWFDAALRHFT